MQVTEQHSIQISERTLGARNEDIKKEVEESLYKTFSERINYHKWQVRRRLYEQIYQTLQSDFPLSDLDPSFKQPEMFCIWIKNLLDESHPSSLNQAIKIIQLYTSKYPLGLKDINTFIGFLIEKASSANLPLSKLESILENCLKQEQIALGLIVELIKYIESKSNKMSLLSLKGISLILTRYELSERKYIDLLFDSMVRILESNTKQIRDVSLQIMSNLIKYSKQPFDVLVNTKLKKIRPIIVKQLKSIVENIQSLTVQDLDTEQQSLSTQQIDLKPLVPSKLYYLETIPAGQKKTILQEFQKSLEKCMGCSIIKKDYFQIYNVIDNLLEESNQIVVSSGLRILKLILKLYGQFLPDSNFKRLFSLTVEKYRGVKSQSLNQQIHAVITSFYISKDLQMESFIDLCFDVIEKNKSQNARVGVIDWWTNQYPKNIESNSNKAKFIDSHLRKKIELIRKTRSYSLIKGEIEALALSLNNTEAIQNRSNIHKANRTQQLPTNLKKQKSTQNILSFTQAMKLTSLERDNMKKKKPQQPHPTTLQNSQHNFQSNPTSNYQSPIRQLSNLQQMQTTLQNIKKSLFSNNRNSMKVFFSDFNLLINKSSGQFFEILNLIMTFLDEMVFSDLKKSKVSYAKEMEFVYEEVAKSVIQLNKCLSSVDEETLRLELQLVLNKVEIGNMRIVETLLDSLYMSSTIGQILRATLVIYKSSEYYFEPIKEFYSNWLSKKIELVDNTGSLHALGQEFQKLDRKVYRSIFRNSQERGIDDMEEEKSINASSERMSFMTPKRDLLKSPSIQRQRSRRSSLSLETSRQSNNILVSEDILVVEQLLVSDYLRGIECFNELLEKKEFQSSKRRSISKSNKVEKVQPSTEFTKILKLICKLNSPATWNHSSRSLIKYKLQYPHSSNELLSMFLVFTCTKQEFKQHRQRLLILNFLEILIQSMQTLSILSKYKSSFLHVFFKMTHPETQTFLVITLPFIISRVLNNELSLNESEYLINPLCFCLMNPVTYDIGNNYLEKIHKGRKSTRGKIEQLLRLKIKDQGLKEVYEEWLNKYTIDEMEIGTISEVPELLDEGSNCKSLVDGLGIGMGLGVEPFGSKSYQSIKFASPIVHPSSKSRDTDSIRKQDYMRQASKSSTIDRPTSILKNFHSSKQILQQSIQHHTQIHHFFPNQQIKQIDTYQYQKQQLRTLLPNPQQQLQLSDSIKQLRELFLTSESNPEQIIENLWEMYISLETEEKVGRFVRDLKVALMNVNFILSLSEVNYYVLLSFVLKLCASIPYEKHESESSYCLRDLLNLFLTYKNPNAVLISCIRILNHHLTQDFEQQLQFQQKLMFRLIINCIDKLSNIIEPQQMRSFQVLLQIYKFFKIHPPETLVQGVPSLKQIQAIFNGLKKVTNTFIQGNKPRAQEFLEFIRRKNSNNIYLTYIGAVIQRE